MQRHDEIEKLINAFLVLEKVQLNGKQKVQIDVLFARRSGPEKFYFPSFHADY
jgi:hypothetical protein